MSGEKAAAPEFTPPPHRARIFTLILLGTFCAQMGLSIITPFFPRETAGKNISATLLGWIFSIFEVAVMLGTPLAMKGMVRVGARPLLIASNCLGGVSNVLLGCCWYVGAGWPFAMCTFALRVLAGFALALGSTAGYGLLPTLYGDQISTATGALEGANGVAMIFGPIAGAALFSLGGGEDNLGFMLPFVVLGVLEFSFALANAVLLPAMPTPPQKQPSMTKFSGKALVPFVNCIVMGIGLGFLGPTLEPHLSAPPLNFSVSMVGWAFSAATASYAIISPLVGWLDDRSEGKHGVVLMGLGALLTAVGYALLGPYTVYIHGSELMHASQATLWSGMAFLGVGVACGLIPVYKQLRFYALHEADDEKDIATAGVFTIALSAGSFLGPTLGGVMAQQVGVQVGYTYVATAVFLLGFVLVPLGCIPAFKVVAHGASQGLLQASHEEADAKSTQVTPAP